jgi:hypothetical protein
MAISTPYGFRMPMQQQQFVSPYGFRGQQPFWGFQPQQVITTDVMVDAPRVGMNPFLMMAMLDNDDGDSPFSGTNSFLPFMMNMADNHETNSGLMMMSLMRGNTGSIFGDNSRNLLPFLMSQGNTEFGGSNFLYQLALNNNGGGLTGNQFADQTENMGLMLTGLASPNGIFGLN